MKKISWVVLEVMVWGGYIVESCISGLGVGTDCRLVFVLLELLLSEGFFFQYVNSCYRLILLTQRPVKKEEDQRVERYFRHSSSLPFPE